MNNEQLVKIAHLVAQAGGTDKDCMHIEHFPCWMESQEDMYCACLKAANKIAALFSDNKRKTPNE